MSARVLALGVSLLPGALVSPAAALDLAEVRERGVLRVIAHVDERRPEFFSADPEAPGFDYEFLAGFARLLGLELQVVEVEGGSDTRLAALREGRGDVVAGRLAALPERREAFGLTPEVFPVRFVLVTRQPTPPLDSLEELRDYRVGTVRTSRALMNLVEAAGVPPHRLDDSFAEPTELAEALRDGRIEAFISGTEAALPAQREDPQLQIGAAVGPTVSLVYAVRKEDAKLLGALGRYVENARRSLSWNRLVVKYFGEDALAVLESGRSPEP